MSYEKFCLDAVQNITDHLRACANDTCILRMYAHGFVGETPEEVKFVRETNGKYGHSSSDSLVGDYLILQIPQQGKSFSQCRFKLTNLYNEFLHGGWLRIWQIVDDNLHEATAVDVDIFTSLDDYDAVKSRLIVCLRHRSKIADKKQGIICEEHDDFAKVVYVIVHDAGVRNRLITPLPRQATTSWGMSDEEILSTALQNSAIVSPPRLYTCVKDILSDDLSVGAFIEPTSVIGPIPAGPVAATVTTVTQEDGAVALFYPGVKERISALVGGNFFVSFTGKDEGRIHRVGSISPRVMKRALADTNLEFPTSKLTDNLYYYDSRRKTFQKV